MKVRWNVPGGGQPLDDKPVGTRRVYAVDRAAVGHNRAEVYIRLGDAVVILPPSAAKRLAGELRQALSDWEARHGAISTEAGVKGGSRRESAPKRVIKELYKSRKVSRRLISVNTRRRKHIPDKDK